MRLRGRRLRWLQLQLLHLVGSLSLGLLALHVPFASFDIVCEGRV